MAVGVMTGKDLGGYDGCKCKNRQEGKLEQQMVETKR